MVNTNILSVNRLKEKDYQIDFYKDKWAIRKDGETVFLANIEPVVRFYEKFLAWNSEIEEKQCECNVSVSVISFCENNLSFNFVKRFSHELPK